MRVILKPAGVALLLAAVAILGWLVLGRTNPATTDAAETTSVRPTFVPTPQPGTLENGGFEGAFAPFQQYGSPETGKAKVSGDIAPGWFDNSDWADVTVAYSADPANPHGGATSQCIVVTEVSQGHAQLAQEVTVKGEQVYTASVWLRASRSIPVTVFFRETMGNETLGTKTATVGPDWQGVSVTIDPRRRGSGNVKGLFVIALPDGERDLTVWADDVTLEPATLPGAKPASSPRP